MRVLNPHCFGCLFDERDVSAHTQASSAWDIYAMAFLGLGVRSEVNCWFGFRVKFADVCVDFDVNGAPEYVLVSYGRCLACP